MAGEDRNFLSRWSERKRAVAEEETGDELPAAEIAASQEGPLEESGEDEEARANREAAEAIDIEKLTYESDFSLFMRRGVPEILKKRAMRKLWTSNTLLANVDGLNDYDENFADPALNVYKSAWKAGRGYLDKLAAEAAKSGEESTSEMAPPAAASSDERSESKASDAKEEEAETADDGAPTADEPEIAEDEPVAMETLDAGETEMAAEPAPVPRVSIRRRLEG